MSCFVFFHYLYLVDVVNRLIKDLVDSSVGLLPGRKLTDLEYTDHIVIAAFNVQTTQHLDD